MAMSQVQKQKRVNFPELGKHKVNQNNIFPGG